ncbi:unnamed protein product [Musa acuminata subsp. burmannicoides]
MTCFTRQEWERQLKEQARDQIPRGDRLRSGPNPSNLLKMLIWPQRKLDKKAAFPHINNSTAATLGDPYVPWF